MRNNSSIRNETTLTHSLWKEEEVVREEVEEVEARRTRGGWWRMRRAPRPKWSFFNVFVKIGTKFHNFSKLLVRFYRALCVCLSLARVRFDCSNFVADGSCGQGGQGTIGGSLFLFHLFTLKLCSAKMARWSTAQKCSNNFVVVSLKCFCVNTNSQLSGGMELGALI